jgi:hypothetical protein
MSKPRVISVPESGREPGSGIGREKLAFQVWSEKMLMSGPRAEVVPFFFKVCQTESQY